MEAEILELVCHSVELKLTTGILFLDLPRIFDRISQLMPFKKLDAYGV